MTEATTRLTIRINGEELAVEAGLTVLAALWNHGVWALRPPPAEGTSDGVPKQVPADLRGALCGMGICSECRVTINGTPHRRACLTLVSPGLEVVT